jgi:hypothetical protein
MIPVVQGGTLRRVVSTEIPNRLGVFRTLAFERDSSSGKQRRLGPTTMQRTELD